MGMGKLKVDIGTLWRRDFPIPKVIPFSQSIQFAPAKNGLGMSYHQSKVINIRQSLIGGQLYT